MRTKGLLIIVMAMFMTITNAFAQEKGSYNYHHGVELCKAGDYDEAMKFLEAEVKDNPNNGIAWNYYAICKLGNYDLDEALVAVNKAIKKLPAKEKAILSDAYDTRSCIYLMQEDTLKALNDLNQAILLAPDSTLSYFHRAEVYYNMNKYDLCERDLMKLIELEPTESNLYSVLAMINKEQENYDKAISAYDMALFLAESDYEKANIIGNRGEAYLEIKDYNSAADDLLSYYDLTEDIESAILSGLIDNSFTTLESKIKAKIIKDKNTKLNLLLAIAYEVKEESAKALKIYKDLFNETNDPDIAAHIAQFCLQQHNYKDALKYINEAITIDEENASYLGTRAEIYKYDGKFAEALEDYTKNIELDSENSNLYTARGQIYELLKDKESAIEDYKLALGFDDYQSELYPLMRLGVLQIETGQTNMGRENLMRAIERDSVVYPTDITAYSYYYLGETEKALETIENIKNNLIINDNEVVHYNLACIYSLMNMPDSAMASLRRSFELGNTMITYSESDEDLKNIRNSSEFKALIKEYKTKIANEQTPVTDKAEEYIYETVTSEIPFRRANGVTYVTCQVNGVPIEFVFDTGASDVMLTSIEYLFLYKQNKVKESDLGGTQSYSTANGDVTQGTILKINNFKIGDIEMNDVKASVIEAPDATPLLGQSVFKNLRHIEIDNNRNVIKVTYKKKIENKKKIDIKSAKK